jgi:cell wall-associated NlpC family hydrolase
VFRTPFFPRSSPDRVRRSLVTLPLAALAALALLVGVSAPAQASPVPGAATLSVSTDAVVSTAASLAGSPYRRGGTTPAGFDCSGFVGYVYKIHGKALPRTAAQIRAALPSISPGQVQAGDLVFVQRGGRVSHVAIVGADGRWWEATRPGKPVGSHQPWSSSVSFGRP